VNSAYLLLSARQPNNEWLEGLRPNNCSPTYQARRTKAKLASLYPSPATCVHFTLVGRCVHGHEIVEPTPTSYASIRTDVQGPIQHPIEKTSHHRPRNITALASGTDVYSLGCGNLHVMNPVGFVC